MLVTGVIGQDSKMETADLIHSILLTKGKKVSVVDINNLSNLYPSVLKDYFAELKRNNTDYLLLKININEEYKEISESIYFDIMIYDDKADDIRGINQINYTTSMRRIFSLLDRKGMAIVNIDNTDLIRILEGTERYTVTYGFNPKASVTTSSVGGDIDNENFMCCLQRSISARNGTLVEPQEYKINIGAEDLHAYNVLAAASFAIVNGLYINTNEPIRLEMQN